jgi:hypothetical protein
MSVVTYDFDPPLGEKRSDSWIADLGRFFPGRALEIMEAPHVEIAKKRRALLAKGRARDPNFVLSKAVYDAAGEGDWIVRIDRAGHITVEPAPVKG